MYKKQLSGLEKKEQQWQERCQKQREVCQILMLNFLIFVFICVEYFKGFDAGFYTSF